MEVQRKSEQMREGEKCRSQLHGDLPRTEKLVSR